MLAHLGLAVFGGELLGCLLWGPFSDQHGRQRAYLLSCLLMLLASVASALSPSYPFLLVARAAVGVGIGGLAVPFDLLCEATPARHRGTLLLLMEGFWVLGSVAVVGLAWGVLPLGGWRYLTGLAALPLLVATLATLFLPESPRWLLERGREQEAWAGLLRAARWNGRDLRALVNNRTEGDSAVPPLPPLVLFQPHHHHTKPGPSHQPHNQDSSFLSTLPRLLHPSLRRTTLCLWVVWFAFGLAYYGIVLYAAALFSSDGGGGVGCVCICVCVCMH